MYTNDLFKFPRIELFALTLGWTCFHVQWETKKKKIIIKITERWGRRAKNPLHTLFTQYN